MDAAEPGKNQFTARLHQSATMIWSRFRSPRFTVGLVIVLLIVLFLGWLIPRSPLSADAPTWTATLPQWLQPWGELLYFLGFARLFHSVWFWAPAALLLFNSLIALADYGPGSWARLGKTVPPVEWQHPVACRDERVVRLPQSPDSFLERVQDNLAGRDFFIYQPGEAEQRPVGAAKRRWAWLGLIGLYVGLLLLIVAFLISRYFLMTERLVLFPLEPESSYLLGGELELAGASSEPATSRVTFLAGETGQSPSNLTWRLYRPALFRGVLVWPIASEPTLTVEVRDEADSLLKLLPVQEELSPAERLNFPLDEAGTPLYFLISSSKLAVQISPNPDSNEESYNVQVRRSSEETLLENSVVQAGETLEIEDLSMTLSRHHNLTVVAYSDPALILYGISLLLVLIGAFFTLLRPPVQVWLIPEVKGIGGQLYGIIEKFGSTKAETEALVELLSRDVASEGEVERSAESSGS